MNNKRIWINAAVIIAFVLFPWYVVITMLALGNVFVRNYWESLLIAVGIDFMLTGGFTVGWISILGKRAPIILLGILLVFIIRNTIFREKHWDQ